MTHNDIIRHFGTQAAAARKLGVTRAAVSIWKKRGIPAGRQILIQYQTRGKLRAGAREA
jgi:DNA-binding transcriptional regulator YdaS (Cro superfamily)